MMMKRMRLLCVLVLGVLAFSGTALGTAVQFVNLGSGKATGLTSDGKIVAFDSSANSHANIYNTVTASSYDIGAGTTAGVAMKGSTVVVAGKVGVNANRWDGTTAGVGSWTALPACSTYTNWTPTSIGASASEVYIGGYVSYQGTYTAVANRAMRYKESVNSATELSLPTSSHNHSYVWGIASNQERAMGQVQWGGAANNPTAGAYNAAQFMPSNTMYNSLSGSPSTSVTAKIVSVSGNGTVYGGRSGKTGGSTYVWGACYWISPTILTELPNTMVNAGWTADYGQVTAISYDGSFLAGAYRKTGDASTIRHAFVWDAVNGTRDLETLLTAAGVNLTNWQLVPQSDIPAPSIGWGGITGVARDGSPHGMWISGFGLYSGVQTGWVAYVPEPATMLLLALGGLGLRRRH